MRNVIAYGFIFGAIWLLCYDHILAGFVALICAGLLDKEKPPIR